MRSSEAEQAASSPRAARLARELPDVPAWIDIRGMLLSGRATVTGGDSVKQGFVVRTLWGAFAVVGVVGRPLPRVVLDALEGTTPMTPLIAQHDNEAYVAAVLAEAPKAGGLPAWRPERAVLHRLAAEPPAVPQPAQPIRLLAGADPLDHLPSGLAFEMRHARELVPVAAAFDGARPVAFCYPCWTTETLWDVSIDTLEPWRRLGLARATAAFMIAYMRERGRAPAWGAMASNTASLRLAARLGFVPDGEAVVFSRGSWAYLTRGFERERRL